jgi:hypothetical protein
MRDLTNTPYGKFIWFIGIAEDTFSDPTQLGRVRVRAIGFHPESKDILPTDSLPLAPVLNGGSAKINPGQMVLGFFMDGELLQQPFILGVINGGVESVGGRFFGAIGNLFKSLPFGDTPEAVTAYKPNPVPGDCILNPRGDIKDANGTLDTSKLVQVGVTSGAQNAADRNNPAFLAKEVAESYLAMVAAAKADGITWVINSAYRSYREQQTEKDRWTKAGKPKNAANAGTSNHGCGLAVDIGTQIFGTSGEGRVYRWLMKNASKFGFRRIAGSGKNESWHWEYTLETSKSTKPKHTPETLPDGTKNIYDEPVKKKPTVVGDKP